MTQKTTLELILHYLPQIAPVNSSVAADLTNLYGKIVDFESKFNALEQRVIDLHAQGVTDLENDNQIIDLNDQSRALALDLLAFPFELSGAVKFTSKLFDVATITANQIGFGAASQAASGALLGLFETFIWDPITIGILPPFEQGTNDADFFVGNIDGGTVELLSGNDIFIPNDTADAYDVDGGSSDDVIFGGASGQDSLKGGSGNDTIIASQGVFSVSGNEGNDWIQLEGGAESNNIANGNQGSDTIIGGAYADDLHGTIVPFAMDANEAPASDINTVVGRGGADTIYGGIGNDFLIGDNLSDSSGTEQNILFADIIANVGSKIENSGASGNDTITGYAGDDIIAGGGGEDHLYGDDSWYPGLELPDGNDIIFGDAGNDQLFGGGGEDKLYGGSGNDHLYAGAGLDMLYGESGADKYYFDSNSGDNLVYDTGVDDEIYINGQRIAGNAQNIDGYFWLENGVEIGFTGHHQMLIFGAGATIVIQNWWNGAYGIYVPGLPTPVRGTENDDTVIGDSEANAIYDEDGNDTSTGGGGTDIFHFIRQAGATDVITDFDVADEVIDLTDASLTGIHDISTVAMSNDNGDAILQLGGGHVLRLQGVDYTTLSSANFNFSPWPNETLHGGEGDDTLTTKGGYDNLYGMGGNDTLDAGAADDVLYGDDGSLAAIGGNDVLFGGDGYDQLYGEGGNDTLNGDADGDQLHGGAGNDVMTGGADQDYFYFAQEANALDIITDFEIGMDYIDLQDISFGAIEDISDLAMTDDNGTAVLQLGGGHVLRLEGVDYTALTNDSFQFFVNYVTGYSGDETLNGSEYKDYINAYAGNTVLNGFGGDDTLGTQTGNNTLAGGLGDDTMSGGYDSGVDIFVFEKDMGASDTIARFNFSEDKIDLSDSSLSYISGFGDLTLSDDDGYIVIALGDGQTIRVPSGWNGTELTEDHFIFAAPPPNTAPVSVSDTYTAAEGGVLTVLAASGVLANDSDADNDDLTAVLVSNVAHGTLTLNVDGSFAYTHDGSENYSDSISYKANDGTEDGNTVTVSFSITPVNDAPVAAVNTYTVAENGILSVAAVNGVLANDSDVENDNLAAVLVSTVTHGALTLNADGSFAYTHDGSANYTDSFTYKANDGSADSNTVTVSFTITAPQGLVIQGTSGADSLIGSAYADSISGGLAHDTIYGGAGDDTLGGDSGNDVVYGEEGNDLITDTSGSNTLNGGTGNDTISAASNSVIDGGDGHDRISATGVLNIFAGAGDDTVSASGNLNNYSVVDLGAGSNRFEWNYGSTSTSATISVVGGEGADYIEVMTGNATLIGGAGDDMLISFQGADYIDAGDGNDTVNSSGGNDTIYAGSGNDIVDLGLASYKRIYGDDGDDQIIVGSHNTLFGGAGNDTISGSSYNVIDAGDGHDRISATGVLNILAGAGDDTVSASGNLNNYSVVNLGAGSNRFEWNYGSISTSATISIAGGEGADYIEVMTGNATLIGGAGDDMLTSFQGADYIDAGDGNDTVNSSGGNDTIYAGAGNDIVNLGLASYKRIYGDDGDDQIIVGSHNTLFGGAGNDTISGSSYNVIDAGDGHDRISATGVLNISAGAGDDTVSASGNLNNYSVVNLGAGSNRFEWNYGSTSTSATISIAGGEGADYIEVKTGNATLIGGAGDDMLIGYSGSDYINAGDGNDTINAGIGNDTIIGGAGADVIVSGGSIDHFIYGSLGDSTDTARDLLTDFSTSDYIDVSALGFTGIQSGAATGTTLGFSVVGGNTIIEAAGSDFSIELTGVINLVAGDFIFG